MENHSGRNRKWNSHLFLFIFIFKKVGPDQLDWNFRLIRLVFKTVVSALSRNWEGHAKNVLRRVCLIIDKLAIILFKKSHQKLEKFLRYFVKETIYHYNTQLK
jgi:hypothetical protein